MCGRFATDQDRLEKLYLALIGKPCPGEGSYNVAPTESAWIVRHDGPDSDELEAAEADWWLTPYWSKTRARKNYATFNAKSETLHKSSTFREPFRRRRCVLPISGFFEWQKVAGIRRPYYIQAATDGLLLAGVWDRWRSADRTEKVDSFAVVTTAAHPGFEAIHNRQPVMLSLDEGREWMDRGTSQEGLHALFEPRLADDLLAIPVSSYVGNPRNKASRCIDPIAPAIRLAAPSGGLPPVAGQLF